MRRLSELFAVVLLAMILTFHLYMPMDQLSRFVLKRFYFNHTYIVNIEAPQYPELKTMLKRFYKKVGVAYPENGHRPINITVVDFKGEKLGFATSNAFGCTIELDSNLPEYYVESTLIHELLHCYGYRHEGGMGNLMHPYLDPYMKSSEYDNWSDRLRREVYGK